MFKKRCKNCSSKLKKDLTAKLNGIRLCQECYDYFVEDPTRISLSTAFKKNKNKKMSLFKKKKYSNAENSSLYEGSYSTDFSKGIRKNSKETEKKNPQQEEKITPQITQKITQKITKKIEKDIKNGKNDKILDKKDKKSDKKEKKIEKLKINKKEKSEKLELKVLKMELKELKIDPKEVKIIKKETKSEKNIKTEQKSEKQNSISKKELEEIGEISSEEKTVTGKSIEEIKSKENKSKENVIENPKEISDPKKSKSFANKKSDKKRDNTKKKGKPKNIMNLMVPFKKPKKLSEIPISNSYNTNTAKVLAEYEKIIERQKRMISKKDEEILLLKKNLAWGKGSNREKPSPCRLLTEGKCIHELMLKSEREECENKIVDLKVEVANYMNSVNDLNLFIFRHKEAFGSFEI